LFGTQQPNGVRIECEHDCGTADRFGSLEQSLHNRHVSAVHTIEIPDRDSAAASACRECFKMANDVHARAGSGEQGVRNLLFYVRLQLSR
jgi:hypothetical protein